VIPVRNLYYLLLYAWDMFSDGQMAMVDAEPDTDLLNLLASVLARGVDRVLRRGLDRGFLPVADDVAGVRGKLELSRTLKANLAPRACTACSFDDLSYDVPHNRVLKATLGNLLRSGPLDREVRRHVRTSYARLEEISSIRLTRRSFSSVQLHQNIRFYRFLIDVCLLLFECLIPDQATGTFRFRDVTQDDERMHRVFERFLYNFYKHEQELFDVRRSQFPWADASGDGIPMLPVMRTDITLLRPGQSIVIDAKYTPHALQQHPYGAATFRSGHLYQMFAYLKNLRVPLDTAVDGLILYPQAKERLDATVALSGHRLRLRTINLNQHWKLIRRDLLALVGSAISVRSSETACE
jgi:5-methylcytosine-specific restriction enzyme subunit McrC